MLWHMQSLPHPTEVSRCIRVFEKSFAFTGCVRGAGVVNPSSAPGSDAVLPFFQRIHGILRTPGPPPPAGAAQAL
eukprot:1158843-Pelagomonas_calceolata.AAC.18